MKRSSAVRKIPGLFLILFLICFSSACQGWRYQSDLSRDYTLKNGMVEGYLGIRELPSSLVLLPPPPSDSSIAGQLDREISEQSFHQRDSARWEQAVKDAYLVYPEAFISFSTIVGVSISHERTPALYILLQRSGSDVVLSTYQAKNYYKRPRPFEINGQPSCTPDIEEFLRDGSYPSGHAAVGWAWALILCELFPENANHLLARGREFGESRVWCNTHWHSDVTAGRFMGAATVARLHGNVSFRADMKRARKEIEKLKR